MIVLTSCYDKGTILTGTDSEAYRPFALNGDTIDLYKFAPADDQLVWIGIRRNHEDVILNYRSGKHNQSIILIDKNSKGAKVIKGNVISENDSVAVIRKIK